jgi:hypothetical protein
MLRDALVAERLVIEIYRRMINCSATMLRPPDALAAHD